MDPHEPDSESNQTYQIEEEAFHGFTDSQRRAIMRDMDKGFQNFIRNRPWITDGDWRQRKGSFTFGKAMK